MKEIKLNRIKSKIQLNKNKQIGNIRFSEETYNKIVELAKDLNVTKQWLIQQIVTDFIFEE